MPPPLRYLSALLLTALALAAGSVGLCVAVDPYYFFGTHPTRWTALKPRAAQEGELAKTYLMERARPATLLLGNSRVEVGLNPQSPYWPAGDRPVFDGALAGHDLAFALLLLQDDLALKAPNLVVLGVDFQDFIQAGDDPSEPPVSARELRLLVDRRGLANDRRRIQIWTDGLTSSLTIDAVTDSLLTLALQNRADTMTITPSGFNPLREYVAEVRRFGAQSLFAQKQAKYEQQYRGFAPSDFHRPEANREFRYLASIENACSAHGVRLIVFTYPYHAEYLDMLHRLGLWPSFEAWKRALTRTVQQSADRGPNIELFDFAQLNRISSEPVPPPGDTHTQMHWYWESGHFKSTLGDKLIARMTGHDTGLGTLLVGAEKKRLAAHS